jgi:methyl-accepting chemotaxis protein
MKWTVGTKIGTGYAAALAMFIVVGTLFYQSLNKLIDVGDWVTHTHKVLEELNSTLQALTDAETGQRGFILTGDEAYLEPYRTGISVVRQYLDDVRFLTQDNASQQRRLDTLDPMVNQRLKSLADLLDLQKSKGPEAAKQSISTGNGKKEMDDIRNMIAEMKDEENRLLKIRNDDAKSSVQNANIAIFAGTAFALVALLLIGIAITRNISGPLRELTVTAEQIAAGDLAVNVHTNHRRDEVGVLAQTFRRMTESLREMAGVAEKIADGDLRVKIKPQSDRDLLGIAFSSMVTNLQRLTSQVTEGVNVLSSSASQISTSTTQLASSATETATAVSQATTTVEEVKQTAQLASQKSRSVSEIAQKTAQISQSGTKSTEETIIGINRIHQQMGTIADSMVRLSEQSQTIGQIVSTVEDLSAQSSILAVNASIEAAKAGEQGKGFAVVAQEVRSLAEQSKQATDQVRNILSEIQKATSSAVMSTEQGSKAVEAGVKQATEAGQAIQVLSSTVVEGAQAATQIAASSQQQLIGVDQVAAAMENIKQASSQNMTSAKQLESAAHNLKELGQKLKQTVDKYKV